MEIIGKTKVETRVCQNVKIQYIKRFQILSDGRIGRSFAVKIDPDVTQLFITLKQ